MLKPSRGHLPAMLCCLCVLVLFSSVVVWAQSGFNSMKTVHIDVRYQRDVSEEDASVTVEYLQNDYSYLSDKLGLDFKKRLEVRIYDTVGKYLRETKQNRPRRGAIYRRGVIHMQPVQALVTRKIFEQTLSYELASALLDLTARKGCPRWLRESFTVYHSGEMAKLSVPIGAKLGYFSDLDQDIQQYPQPPQRDDVHYVLGLTMKYFIEQYGEDKAFSVYKAFNGITPINSVFKKVFKKNFETIERTWANYIAAETEKFKEQ